MPHDGVDQAHASCRLKQELELKQHALSLLEERIAGSESASLAAAAAATQAELDEATQAAAAARQRQADLATQAKVFPCLRPSLSAKRKEVRKRSATLPMHSHISTKQFMSISLSGASKF